MHDPHEHLEADDCVDDDDEEDEEADVHQRDQRHHDRVQHNLREHVDRKEGPKPRGRGGGAELITIQNSH